MEIEAKFKAPDQEILRGLAEAPRLAGFPLSAGTVENLSDTYMDTARWLILAAGFACRRRVGDDRILITLKQLRGADEVVHRREEYEVEIAEDLPPDKWPESPARTKVLDIIGDEHLAEVLDLRQKRVTRLVGAPDNPVAELSLDEVDLGGPGASDAADASNIAGASSEPGTHFFEVEAELKAGGTERDLAAIVSALRKEWHLEPEPLSKFERAVALAWEKPVLETAPLETAPSDGDTSEATSSAAVPPTSNAAPPPTSSEAVSPTSQKTEQRSDSSPAGDAVREECRGLEQPADFLQEPVAGNVAVDQAAPDEGGKEPEAAPKRSHKHGKKQRFLGDGLTVLEKPGLTAGDTMAEAADKTLLYHLQRMMLHEPGTRDGEDAEELHDMRVATRRMRAALRVFGDYLDMDAFRPHLKLMQETGRELGTVRDLDVFRIKTQVYIDSLPPEERSGLDPLLEAWAKERERARTELITFLDSSRYQHFKERFEHFLRTPGAGAGPRVTAEGEPLPSRVRDVLPGVVFDRLASVRAFDEWITRADAPLARFHQLRITSKGLRYTLEFFSEVLGPDSKALIDKTKLLQDHLGDLQDAVVTCDVLLGFLSSGTWGPPRQGRKDPRPLFPVNAPGLATYLAVKQYEIERLMSTFGPVWEQVRGPEFSRPLAALVGAL